jgi:atypical dual specificity phosphatase
MSAPNSFSWVEVPYLAASASPFEPQELLWLREQGIDIILTLTEDPLPRRWVDEAGLMSVHVPIADMEAPTHEQFEQCVSVIRRAAASKMGVLVHCLAGRGRTGTILAAYLVSKGLASRDAIRQVRQIRPGSIETGEQEQSIHDWARSKTK